MSMLRAPGPVSNLDNAMSREWPSKWAEPPPSKRAKNNPVIVRYPPPSSYAGSTPAVPLSMWHLKAQDQQITSEINAAPQRTQQSFTTSQLIPPQPLLQESLHSATNHPSWPGLCQIKPPTLLVKRQTHRNSQTLPVTVQSHAVESRTRYNNDFSQYPYRSTDGSLLDGNGDPMPHCDPASEDDYHYECWPARIPELFDPDLSIGFIEWKAALPAKRPLPPTFAEAELEALAPRKPQIRDDESISAYFKESKRHEALLNVRQTESWFSIKDDLVFREFPTICSDLLSLEHLRERFCSRKVRADRLHVDTEPEPADDMQSIRMDGKMIYGDANLSAPLANRSGPLQGSTLTATAPKLQGSETRTKLTRPKQLPLVRDQRQEDMLAALGVSGSPRQVYETPGPAFGPPPEATHSRASSTSSTRSIGPAAMPVYPYTQAELVFKPRHHNIAGPFRHSRAKPSNYDCENIPEVLDDNQPTPRPSLLHHDSRKRSYADRGEVSSMTSSLGDMTPKPRKHARQTFNP